MTAVQEVQLLAMVTQIHAMAAQIHAVVTKDMSGPLVGDALPRPARPTKEETAIDPGKYYKTNDDPMEGYVKDQPVIEAFSEMVFDKELNKEVPKSGFVGGTLYDWAKLDFKAFMAYFQFIHNNTPLNLDRLHPEQRSKMGLVG